MLYIIIYKETDINKYPLIALKLLVGIYLLGQGPVFIVEFFADPKNEALKTIIPLAMRVVKLL